MALSLRKRLSRAYRALMAPAVGDAETPIGSFPFLSGDTFLQMAGHVFTGSGVRRRFGLRENLCFASSPVAIRDGFLAVADEFLSKQARRDYSLLIHNGDSVPSQSTLNELGQMFSRVYCVNVVEETPSIRALPIGLENARLNNNGRLSYYLEGLETPRSADRPRLVVASFHVSNNTPVRVPTANLFRASRFRFHSEFLGRKAYRDVLKETCFVISPPGNGADCHRTWEAIYMGAIPVVLEGHLASSLKAEMPILVVESYEEFVEKSDDSLREIYSKLVRKPAAKAFASYWIGELS